MPRQYLGPTSHFWGCVGVSTDVDVVENHHLQPPEGQHLTVVAHITATAGVACPPVRNAPSRADTQKSASPRRCSIADDRRRSHQSPTTSGHSAMFRVDHERRIDFQTGLAAAMTRSMASVASLPTTVLHGSVSARSPYGSPIGKIPLPGPVSVSAIDAEQ